jgi:exopolysaccharide production protein ExoQ
MNNLKKFINIEQGLTVLILLIYQGAVFDLILSGGRQESELVTFDSTPIRAVYFLTYLVSFILLTLRWKRTLYFLGRNWLIWTLILLPAVSIVWSFDPDTTIKNSFTLFGSSLFGVYLASRYSFKDQLKLISWSAYIMIFSSIIFAIALPKYGLMSDLHQGKWRGVFLHKNGLGNATSISSIVFLIRAYSHQGKNRLIWVGLGLSLVLLLLSGSTSSLIVCLLLITGFFLFQILRWSYFKMIPTVLAIATIGAGINFWLANNSSILFGAVGKDATLTGRKDLWLLVWDMIWKQPWLGYGYGAFWRGYDGPSATIWWSTTFAPGHAHSGYLTLLLDLGFMGLAIFWIGFGFNTIKSLVFMHLSRSSEDTWPLIFLLYLLIINQSESALMGPNSTDWVFYVAISFVLDEKVRLNQILTREKKVILS